MARAADPFTGATTRPASSPWAAEAFQVQKYGTRYYCDPLPGCDIAPATDETWPGFTSMKPSKPFRKSITVGDEKMTVPLEVVAPYEWLHDQPLSALADTVGFARGFFDAGKVARDRNFARGYAIHAAAEAALNGTAIPKWALANADAIPYIPHVLKWIEANVREGITVEAVVINRTLGHGGTGDLFCILADGQTAYVDWKSRGEDSKHDIYEEEVMQGGAYSGADYMIAPNDDRTAAVRVPVPAATVGVVVSIRPDGVEEFRYDIAKAQEAFRSMAGAYHATKQSGKLARAAVIRPPRKRKAAVPAGADGAAVEPQSDDVAVVAAATSSDEIAAPAAPTVEQPPADVAPPASAGNPAHPLTDAPPPDEGGPADPALVAALGERFKALPEEVRTGWWRQLVREANEGANGYGRVPYRLGKTDHTMRRYDIARGLVTLAEHYADLDFDYLRAIVAAVIPDDCVWWPTVLPGQVVGMLGATEAARFAAICERMVAEPGVRIGVADDGHRLVIDKRDLVGVGS